MRLSPTCATYASEADAASTAHSTIGSQLRLEVEQEDEMGEASPFEFMFETEATVFYKEATTRELDHSYGDLHGEIIDRELEILQAFERELQPLEDMFVALCEALSDLDCLYAFARCADVRGYSRPSIAKKATLSLRQSRWV